MPQCPHLAIETGEHRYPFSIDGHDDITRLDLGAGGGSFGSDADNHDLVFDLGRIKAEPWPHGSVDATKFAEIVEHRVQQIDRHNHIEMLVLAFACTLKLKRTDPDQLSCTGNQRR